jgi:hypothetical protein
MTAPGALRKAFVIGLTMIGALVVTIQLVPYGHERSTPRVVSEPSWRLSPEGERALVEGLTATLASGANTRTHED